MDIKIPSILDIIDFFVITIMFKYIFVHGVADICMKLFKLILLRTKEEVVTWTHYSEGSRGKGHIARTPHECNDGLCKQMNNKNASV